MKILQPKTIRVIGGWHPVFTTAWLLLKRNVIPGLCFTETEFLTVDEKEEDFRKTATSGMNLLPDAAISKWEINPQAIYEKLQQIQKEDDCVYVEQALPLLKIGKNVLINDLWYWFKLGEIFLSFPKGHPLSNTLKKVVTRILDDSRFDLVVYVRFDRSVIEDSFSNAMVQSKDHSTLRAAVMSEKDIQKIERMISIYDEISWDMKGKCLIVPIEPGDHPKKFGVRLGRALHQRGLA